MIVQRDDYLQQLIAGMHNGLIKIVTGIRRSGKSFLPHEQETDRDEPCLVVAIVSVFFVIFYP